MSHTIRTTGFIDNPIEVKSGENTDFTRFSLRTENPVGYKTCLAFGDMAHNLYKMTHHLMHPKLTIVGKNGRENDGSIIITGFTLCPTTIQQSIKQEKAVALDAVPRQLEREHEVLIPWGETYSWHKKENCIKVSETWYHKLDYCIELLTADYVNARLKKEFGQLEDLSNRKKTKISKEQYETFLENLMREANGETEPPMEKTEHDNDQKETKITDGEEIL